MNIPSEYISKRADVADQVIRKDENFLRTVERALLCLIATFFEDYLRMWFQWNEQREYMDMSWRCSWFLATLFVLINFFGQIGGCVMIIDRFKIGIAVGLFLFIVALQTIAYSILWDLPFLLRNLALIGALVLSESRIEVRSFYAGVPSLGENKVMQLAGLSLLAFMFITFVIISEFSSVQIIQDIVASILVDLVVIGYKTKFSALILVALLSIWKWNLNYTT